jgi:hypothetical protein
MFKAIPFLAIVVIAYNVIALLTGPALSSAVMSATLPSGAAWTLTLGDLLILAGISLLFLESSRPAARDGRGSITRCRWCCLSSHCWNSCWCRPAARACS